MLSRRRFIQAGTIASGAALATHPAFASQIEEIVPTLDDDLLYGFVKLRYRGLQKNATQLSRCARW